MNAPQRPIRHPARSCEVLKKHLSGMRFPHVEVATLKIRATSEAMSESVSQQDESADAPGLFSMQDGGPERGEHTNMAGVASSFAPAYATLPSAAANVNSSLRFRRTILLSSHVV